DPKKFTVEDSAFGFITMENGATIVLEASWALNTLDVGEARTSLSGTEGGADMEDGLRINGEAYSQMYEKKIQLDADGVDFYDGEGDDPALIEAEQWLDAILNNTEPVVKPEQALVVTQILEAIYESSKTGQPVYFN
ncbi:Gfo/Idh/MocA family oxidoreductase, partial [Listeria ivanovii FSL F6-596]